MRGYIDNFLRYKVLLKELVIRDLKVKYRRSALGYLWSVLNPLFMMIVTAIVFSYMFRYEIENYTLYLLSGQIIYNFYSEATNTSMTSILWSGSLLKKVHVPKYIFPLARTFSAFVNLLFSLTAILLMFLITRTPVTPVALLFPLPLFYLLLLCTGIGLILSVMAVYFRDMLHLYGIFLTALMYFTPVFYPVSALPEYAKSLIRFNPLYHIVGMFRNIVLYGQLPTVRENLICLTMGTVAVVAGLLVFKKNQDDFIFYI